VSEYLDRDGLVRLAVAACVLNLVLVGALAGTGVLRTAERGDIQSVTTTQIDGKEVTVPEPGYVIEDPTDADFFYNIVVHVRAGGELYPGNGFEPFAWSIHIRHTAEQSFRIWMDCVFEDIRK